MSDSLTLARQFREALLRRDAAAQAEVLRAYERIWKKLSAEIERVVTQIQARGNAPSLIFEQRRLQQLQHQVAKEINGVAATASEVTLREQARVVEQAREHSTRLMQAAGPRLSVNFASLAREELQHLIGVAQDGSPVADVFKAVGREMGLASGDVIKNGLIEGLALGQNPKRIAAVIRDKVRGIQGQRERDPKVVQRLNTNVRQSILGSYREATRLGYAANSELLSGWVWTAVRSATTCIVCWAMDGRVFPADQPLVSHVNCRCVMRPLLPGQSPGQLGPEAFGKLERGVQKDILGDLAFSAYELGQVKLDDFVGIRTDDRWGDSRFRRGLEEIIGKAEVQKLRKKQK